MLRWQFSLPVAMTRSSVHSVSLQSTDGASINTVGYIRRLSIIVIMRLNLLIRLVKRHDCGPPYTAYNVHNKPVAASPSQRQANAS